jgi:hypothetical protein
VIEALLEAKEPKLEGGGTAAVWLAQFVARTLPDPIHLKKIQRLMNGHWKLTRWQGV